MCTSSIVAVEENDPQIQAIIYSSGEVLFIPRKVENVKCDKDKANPNSDVYCAYQYGSWSWDALTGVDLDFYEGHEGIDLTDYVPSPVSTTLIQCLRNFNHGQD